ncbi:MAG TPA: hypothetical protein VKE24_13230 [Candidatus Acidoferrales bacterium]|nr:hypothetical protein [Candidatus Acidoferrales bacterium]
MAIKIEHDRSAPTAAVELPLKHPLPDFDLEEVEAPVPRDVDPMLASQGFKDLLDEARSILEEALDATGLEIAQLTGAICPEGAVYRPGIWLVLRESGAQGGQGMSAGARARVAAVAEDLRSRLGLL